MSDLQIKRCFWDESTREWAPVDQMVGGDSDQIKKEIDSARKDVCEALAMLSSRYEARVQYEEEMQLMVRACATLRNIKI